ncbi:ROK family protein [Brooklawnia cerclae]|uniref:NBD/HSP70 family sugar kinase n=1 Tax=Brooklawnia cerclae TaxID=349934 RepID=A0ABX0SFA2_9ACTN|nr:ROK family protein [Brooklawnia cerclae]NIH57062.1 putative NBD/HSP70 family sugar kinase [Brooklawnia cerclae]
MTSVNDRGHSSSGATRILEALRTEPALLREDLGRRTKLSPASVTRTTSALIRAGLVRELRDNAAWGGRGRPAIPLALVEDRHVCIGVHLGSEMITIAAGDLRGQILAQLSIRNADCSAQPIGLISRAAGRLLNEFLDRELLSAGLVAPWHALGLSRIPVARKVHTAFGVPVATGDQIEAIVDAELTRRQPPPGQSCYIYARNVSGFAMVLSDGTRTEISRVADLTHVPTGSRFRCPCGRTGCFGISVGERAVVARAVQAGIISTPSIDELEAAARTGNRGAFAIMQERAALMGRAVALVRDMQAPDRIVLLGQAVPDAPSARAMLLRGFRGSTALGPIDLVIPDDADIVQAAAACSVALRPIYEDPIAVTSALEQDDSEDLVFTAEATRPHRRTAT